MEILVNTPDPCQSESGIRSIFFQCSSRKHFANPIEKEAFFQRWAGVYLEHFPQEVLLAFSHSQQLMAYLMGCADSQRAQDQIAPSLPSYLVFQDLFAQYPAHLHINCDPHFQGQGVGSALIDAYCEVLKQKKVPGVHIVTSPEADNVSFYLKKGFHFRQQRPWRDSSLLFMGQLLDLAD